MYSVYSKSFATWDLNDSSDLAAVISGGKLFQSLTVLTKNDNFLFENIFNMDWRILVHFIPRFWLGIKY